MKNAEVFARGFDTVVALTVKAINGQLQLLTDPTIGCINSTIVAAFEPSTAVPPGHSGSNPLDYVPVFYDSLDNVPKEAKSGYPQYTTISGQFLPSITILPNNSPDNDVRPQKLNLTFTWLSGQLWQGGTATSWPITGWTWQVDVDLGVNLITNVNPSMAAPPVVMAKLKDVVDGGNTVFSLFIDFSAGCGWDSTTAFEPDVNANVTNHNAMVAYFNFFQIRPDANPYHLGYTLTQASQVPPSLMPLGCTYSLSHNTDAPLMSTVNFIFNSVKSRPGRPNIKNPPGKGLNAYPGQFDDLWVSSAEQQIDGRIIYSAFSFLETLIMPGILAPCAQYFNKLPPGFSTTVGSPYQRMLDDTTDGPDTAYMSINDMFYPYNRAEVDWWMIEGDPAIRLNGAWHEYLPHGYDKAKEAWTTTVPLTLGIEDNNPVLRLGTAVVRVDDATNPATTKDKVDNVFAAVAKSTLPTHTNSYIMLPGGDLFFTKGVSLLKGGHLSMEVKIMSSTGLGEFRQSEYPDLQNLVTTDCGIGKVSHFEEHNALGEPQVKHRVCSEPVPMLGAEPLADSSNLGLPMSDLFTLDLTGTMMGKLDTTVSCELMPNCKVAMPISAAANMIAAQDAIGRPLVCSIGTDKQLNLLVAKSGSTDSGWTTINLLQSFVDHSTAILFDMVQDAHGLMSLAFTAKNDSTGADSIFFASMLSNDLDHTNFANLAAVSQAIFGIDADFAADSIRIGSSTDGKRPLLTIEGTIRDRHMLYQLRDTDTHATELELPEDPNLGASSMRAHCTGMFVGFRMNYFLYQKDTSQRLIGYTNDSSNSEVFSYSDSIVDCTVNCIASGDDPSRPRFSDLYVAGSTGIYRFPDGVKSKREHVASEVIVGNVTSITIARDGNNVSLWTIDDKQTLFYTRGGRSSTSSSISWNTPISFAQSVSRVAPTRSPLRNTNELFVLDQMQSLTHHWQDPISTIWRKSTAAEQVKGKVSGHVTNFDSWTTHVHLEKDGRPLVGLQVKVTSSEWQYLTINNVAFSVDKNSAASATSDAMGNITIIAPASDIAPPVLHVTGSNFAEIINIYANGKVHTHMANIKVGTDLQGAVGQDGKQVLPSNIQDDVADGVATRTAQIHDVATGDFAPATSKNTFVVVEYPDDPSSRGLKHTLSAPINIAAMPNDVFLALKFDHGCKSMVMWDEGEARAHIDQVEAHGLMGIFDWIGDAWHALESAAESAFTAIKDKVVEVSNGISFVMSKIDNVVTFVITLYDKALKFAVTTFLEAFKAINALLKLIGIDLSAILRWLGHLFGWDKIWDTHKIIASATRNFVTFAQQTATEYIDTARHEVNSAFANLESRLSSLSVQTPSTLVSSAVVVSNSPQGNFAYYHLSNALAVAPTTASKLRRSRAPGKSSSNQTVSLRSNGASFDDQIQKLIAPTAMNLLAKLGTDAQDLITVINSRSNEDTKKLVLDLLQTFLDPVESLVDTFLDFFSDIVGSLADFFDDDPGMPMLGALYEFVTGLMNDGNGEDLTILNGLSFIMAVAIVPTLSIYGLTQLPDLNGIGCDLASFPAQLRQALTTGRSTATQTFQLSLLSPDPRRKHQIPSLGEAPMPPNQDLLEDFSLIFGAIQTIACCASSIASAFPKELKLDAISKTQFHLALVIALSGFPMPADGQPLDTWLQRIGCWVFSSLVSILTSVPENADGTKGKVNDAFEGHEYKGEKLDGSKVKGMVSLVVQIPVVALAIEIDAREGSDALTWFSDMFGQLGGIVNSLGQVSKNDEVVVASLGLVVLGAACAFGDYKASEQNNKVVKRILGPW